MLSGGCNQQTIAEADAIFEYVFVPGSALDLAKNTLAVDELVEAAGVALWGPAGTASGSALEATVAAALSHGAFPLMIGYTSDEGSLFVGGQSTSRAVFSALLREVRLSPTLLLAVYSQHAPSSSADHTALLSRIVADSLFACPVLRLAKGSSAAIVQLWDATACPGAGVHGSDFAGLQVPWSECVEAQAQAVERLLAFAEGAPLPHSARLSSDGTAPSISIGTAFYDHKCAVWGSAPSASLQGLLRAVVNRRDAGGR